MSWNCLTSHRLAASAGMLAALIALPALLLATELHRRDEGVIKGRAISQARQHVDFEINETSGTALIRVPGSEACSISLNDAGTAWVSTGAPVPASTEPASTAPSNDPPQSGAGTPKPSSTSPAAKYKDGVYTGTGKGHRGDIVVEVTVKNGKVESLKIVKQREDAKYYRRATAVIKNIVEKQDTKGVDIVSGATHSSRGIINGTAQALGKARPPSAP